MTIKFGTSGWRDLLADGFTFRNVRICAQAIAEETYRQKHHNKPFIVGYDTRFLSERFALEAARILANNGMEVQLSDRDVPTPVVAFQILQEQAGGGINITASHNPYDYNGLKFSTAWGGPALPEATRSVEALCALIAQNDIEVKGEPQDKRLAAKLITQKDFRTAYMRHVKSLVDPQPFKKRRLKVVVDALYGTARGYLAEALRELGCDVEVLHESRDVFFGGKGPDPSPAALEELARTVKKRKADLGLATDGDGDRFGVIDADGAFFTPNDILALLTRHLAQSRKLTGIVARSVMTTHAMDAVARKYGMAVKETPVGFKHIGEIMRDAESVYPEQGGEFALGGEESGGFSMRGHVPEKDGILACLLIAEMIAATKGTVRDVQKDLFKEVGTFLSRRINLRATPEVVTALKDRFSHKPPTEINGLSVHRIIDLDGFKFIFQGGSWLGVRFSGTEPVIRLYCEADSEARLDVLQKAGEGLLAVPTPVKKPAPPKKRSLAHR